MKADATISIHDINGRTWVSNRKSYDMKEILDFIEVAEKMSAAASFKIQVETAHVTFNSKNIINVQIEIHNEEEFMAYLEEL